MHFRKLLSRSAAAVLSAAVLGTFGAAFGYSRRLPDHVTTDGTQVVFGAFPEITAEPLAEDRVQLSLMGTLPVKSVSVSHREPPVLIAGGEPFGIKLLMDGVMVTGMGEVESCGAKVCPAQSAGVKKGDVIRSANGRELTSNSDLRQVIAESKGKAVELDISRQGNEITISMIPVFSDRTKSWQGGLWVRDSIAGIGTITFIDKATGKFAGLGHPVCDSDTGELIPLHSGEAVPVRITDAKKGQAGLPGELHVKFTGLPAYGTLELNSECGVFGRMQSDPLEKFAEKGQEYKLGYRQEITVGDAYILSTVHGAQPKMYSVTIERVDYNSRDESKNMMLKITDKELIEASGGIVQGMSGSPIIQNDRIIGAVTHVFVSDPTRGYGIFAENMMEQF